MPNEINWKPEIRELIEYKNFKEFTPIQAKSFPVILRGRDLIGISPTGTGKSHAFILPVLQKIDTERNQIQAVVISPTRELAEQLYEQFNEITRFNPDYRVKLIVSGRDKQRMISSLTTSPHIVIGTVGRLKDLFVDEAVLRLEKASMLVIDEADMTLEQGYLEEVDYICGRMGSDLQMMIYSATIPAQLQPFLKRYLRKPVNVTINEEHFSNPHIKHVLVNCRYASYTEKLMKILPGINPYICLIFVRNKQEIDEVYQAMTDAGYKVLQLHSALDDRKRRQALKTLTNEDYSYVICSDVMARGLDIASVSHVISLGLPYNTNYYIHRSGRTGRIGRSGTSILLFNQKDIPGINILRGKGIEFEYEDYRRGFWTAVKPFDFKPKKAKTEADLQIEKIINKPVKKVKPGYKKKREKEIEDIKRRERRLMIRQQINKQKKERAKAAQRAKGNAR